jgi:hypothetical protein
VTATELNQLAFSRRQAADACGLSVDTIAAAILSGDLRAVQVTVNGKKVNRQLILRKDLEAWLERAS